MDASRWGAARRLLFDADVPLLLQRDDREAADRAEFESIMLSHLGVLRSVARRLTRNGRDAEDLVQDAIERAIVARHQFRPGSNCRAWLLRILTNSFISQGRRHVRERAYLAARQAFEPSEAPGRMGPPDREAARIEVSGEIRRALGDLSREFRAVVVLCDVEGLHYREIADRLGCPVGTVMSRLHRARRQLQKRLVAYSPKPDDGTPRPDGPGGAAAICIRRRAPGANFAPPASSPEIALSIPRAA